MKRLFFVWVCFCAALVFAGARTAFTSGTYIPPPPPKVAPKPDKVLEQLGKEIFKYGIYRDGAMVVYHHLGPRTCASCHRGEKGFDAKRLASRFDKIDTVLKHCVEKRAGGDPRFLDLRTKKALKVYLFYHYKLHKFRLSDLP